MMAGLFLLLQIVMVLIWRKKRTAAVVVSLVAFVLSFAIFAIHMTGPLEIRL
jgi:hypothetical protein